MLVLSFLSVIAAIYIDRYFLIVVLATLFLSLSTFKITKSNKIIRNNTNVFNTLILDIIFINIFTVSVYYFRPYEYVRPIWILYSILLMILILGVKIRYTKASKYICLFQIFLLVLFARATVYYQFPGPIGVDPWYHFAFINRLIESGNIPDLGSYKDFPLFHLLISSILMLTGLTIKNSSFVMGGFIMFIPIVFIFVIGKTLFNDKIALIGALILSISNEFSIWSFWIIPMSLGLVFFTIIIYFYIKPYNVRFSILKLILAPTIIFTHTISTFIMLSTLFIGNIITILDNRIKNTNIRSTISNTFVLYFFIIMIFYWITVTGWGLYFFSNSVFSDAPYTAEVTVPSINKLVLLKSEIPLLYLVFLGIIGSLHLFNNNLYASTNNKKIVLLTWTVTAFIFIFYALGIGQFLPERWFIFMYVMMMPFAAFGIFKLTPSFDKKAILLFVIILLSFSNFNITNYKSDVVNNFQNDIPIDRGLQMNEVKSIEWIYANSDKVILVDDHLKITIHSFDNSTRFKPFISKPEVFDINNVLVTNKIAQQINSDLQNKNTIYSSGETIVESFG